MHGNWYLISLMLSKFGSASWYFTFEQSCVLSSTACSSRGNTFFKAGSVLRQQLDPDPQKMNADPSLDQHKKLPYFNFRNKKIRKHLQNLPITILQTITRKGFLIPLQRPLSLGMADSVQVKVSAVGRLSGQDLSAVGRHSCYHLLWILTTKIARRFKTKFCIAFKCLWPPNRTRLKI